MSIINKMLTCDLFSKTTNYLLLQVHRLTLAQLYRHSQAFLQFPTLTHISCSMDTCDLPEIYALALRPLTHRPECKCTFQANHLCPCYSYYIYTECPTQSSWLNLICVLFCSFLPLCLWHLHDTTISWINQSVYLII